MHGIAGIVRAGIVRVVVTKGCKLVGVHLAASQCLVEQQQPYLEIDMEGLQVGARACWNNTYVFGETGAALPVW
jgi:hypothetical protein